MKPAAPVTTYLTRGTSPGHHPIDAVGADQEETSRLGHHRRVFAVGKAPELLPAACAQGVGAALERREVHDVSDHRGRAGDLSVRREGPTHVAGRRIEC